ncbi:MAG: hypothetical protein AVDCRST_MAG14-2252 [uncultured Rubrobacteraceae bacterium]|uniref:Uncharacterized protein n=1 Tax=uncultured Rubrobacteraceae bacterium TaxID=349277 RepID=A0A6J4QZU8_9ACTN|nr:MAG: hypothetical protein AVDCRST_MAG14-2252 [uncultured Rubrobacteraceae bacterium]
MEPPSYPRIWQCVDTIVGYAIAALNSLHRWLVVLAGLLGKVLGPIGFLSTVVRDTLSLSSSLTNLTNRLIW